MPYLFLKGMAMGIAEVIPGVSGGTIAFVTGIYERLLNAINGVISPAPFRLLRTEGVAAAWKALDGNFLALLLGGMATGLIGGIFGITYLLEHYPSVIWAFFFGLIISSVIYVGRQVGHWRWIEGLMLLLGAGLAYYITVASPLQGSQSLIAVFFSGAIAICALMLPGISGSFVLLLLGMYTYILGSVKLVLSTLDGASMVIVAVFAAGCLTGMGGFSRLLTWTLARFHNPTMAILTGFMVGSLNKLWPWRNVLEYRTNSHGEQVPFREANVWPSVYDGTPYTIACIVAVLLGFVLVLFLERLGQKSSSHTAAK